MKKSFPTASVICSALLLSSALVQADNYYVSDAGSDRIVLYNSGGGSGSTFANSGLSSPEGLAFRNGFLYVANFNNGTIRKYDSSGNGTLFANPGVSGHIGLASDS